MFVNNSIVNHSNHKVSGRRGSATSSVDRTKSSTLGGRGSAKSRTRSKSPFRSFRWPKSKSPKSEGQSGREAYSDDEDNVQRATFGKNLIFSKYSKFGTCFPPDIKFL